MKHILDNPIWNALISGNKMLAKGNARFKYFTDDVSPFVGLPEYGATEFEHLHDAMATDRTIIIFSAEEIQIPKKWKLIRLIKAYQMLFEGSLSPDAIEIDFIPLRRKHVPEMLALTKLTNPGPFFDNTIKFGDYEGVFKDNTLVAMAGQRLHVDNYWEISAVCTHPNHLGKGYASQLLLNQVRRIQAASNIPFLHVTQENTNAVKLYSSLGFGIRKTIYIYVIQKDELVMPNI